MPKRIAICIGVDYLNTSYQLSYACADAESVANLLRDKARGGFDEVIELLEANATREKIINTINHVLSDSTLTQDDLVLIYFSGHGTLDKADNLFLVPRNFGFIRENQTDKSTMVYISDFERYLDNGNAGTVILMLDACHAGGAGKLLGGIKYKDSSNVIVVGAARFSEKALESPELAHGRFTQALLGAINQHPTEGEWITLPQTLAFIEKEMAKMDTAQMMEVSSHAINQHIKLFRNPLYSLISEPFIKQVQELCEVSGGQILSLQPNLTIPNAFIMREQGSFGRYSNSLIFCLNNDMVDVTKEDIEQVKILFNSSQNEGLVTQGMIVTYHELSPSLKQLFYMPMLTVQTIYEMQRNLMNLEPYLKQLIHDFEEGSDDENDDKISLKSCYVELDAEILDPTFFKNRRPTFKASKPVWAKFAIRKPIGNVVNEWLSRENEPANMILGGYGTGKTTVCRKIGYDLAKKYISTPNKYGLRIPIIFPLRKFPKYSQVEMKGFIVAQLSDYCKNLNFSAFESMSRLGLFLLIFDGFDEMAIRADEVIIQRNFDEIVKLTKVPNAKVLIASRPEVFLSEREETEVLRTNSESHPEFDRIQLCSFTEEQINLYLQERIPLISSAIRGNHGWEFYRDQINSILGLRELAEHPVLLEMTIKTLPKLIVEGGMVTRSRIYETYLSGEIERQMIKKKRDYLIEKQRRLNLIQMVACYMYFEGKPDLTQEQIRNALGSKFTVKENSDTEGHIRDFISCSFMKRDENSFSFSHRSIMEYLVAKEIANEVKQKSPNLLKQFTFNPTVRDFLVDLISDFNDDQRNELWTLIYYTATIDSKTAMYIGGNLMTLLNFLGESFEGKDLKYTKLIGANLQNAKCSLADFSSCDLSEVNFTHSSFTKANLSEVNLSNANLSTTNLSEVNLSNANLSNVNLSEINLSNANLFQAKLIDSNLINVDFSGANLRHAELISLNLTNVNFSKILAEGIKCDESFKNYLKIQRLIYEINFDSPNLFKRMKITLELFNTLAKLKPESDSIWRETLWKWIYSTTKQSVKETLYLGGNAITLLNFLGESFKGKDLNHTKLDGANLSNVSLLDVNLSNADLSNTNLSNANLSKVNLSNANLFQAKLISSSLTSVDFSGANLRQAELTSINLTDVNFSRIFAEGINCDEVIGNYIKTQRLVDEINFDSPDLFKQSKITLELFNVLTKLKPESDSIWRETLWKWIYSTAKQSAEESLYLGGNAITLLNFLSESFEEKDLSRTRLIEANLENAKCSRANFSFCDLNGANFTKADLVQTTFIGVICSNTCFKNSDLSRAKFINGDLTNADFTRAKLQLVEMTSVIITGASFSNESLEGLKCDVVVENYLNAYFSRRQETKEIVIKYEGSLKKYGR